LPLIEYGTARWALCSEPDSHEETQVTIGFTYGPTRLDGKRLTAELRMVGWTDACSHVLVVSDHVQQPLLVALDAPGVSIVEGTDAAGARRDRVELRDVSCLVLRSGPTAEEVRVRVGLLRSAALVGAERGTYRLTRKYVRDREQFGRPLVKLPAVATALAAIRVDVIRAETALEFALERAV